MKLHSLAPFLSETIAEDDPFAPSPALGISAELIERLERRKWAVGRELWRTKESLYHMVDHTKGCVQQHRYPGGWSQAEKDAADKKVILITFDKEWGRGKRRRSRGRGKIPYVDKVYYVVQNTPAGQAFVATVHDKIARVYDLLAQEDRLHAKLLRDRRTVTARELAARQAIAIVADSISELVLKFHVKSAQWDWFRICSSEV